jgi:hypothetical protein
VIFTDEMMMVIKPEGTLKVWRSLQKSEDLNVWGMLLRLLPLP